MTTSRLPQTKIAKASQRRGMNGVRITPVLAQLLRKRGLSAVIFLASLGQILLTAYGLPGWQCVTLEVTGIYCPGCGLSRGAAAIGVGQIVEATRCNPLTLPLFGAITLFGLSVLLDIDRREKLANTVARIESATGIVPFCLLIGLIHAM